MSSAVPDGFVNAAAGHVDVRHADAAPTTFVCLASWVFGVLATAVNNVEYPRLPSLQICASCDKRRILLASASRLHPALNMFWSLLLDVHHGVINGKNYKASKRKIAIADQKDSSSSSTRSLTVFSGHLCSAGASSNGDEFANAYDHDTSAGARRPQLSKFRAAKSQCWSSPLEHVLMDLHHEDTSGVAAGDATDVNNMNAQLGNIINKQLQRISLAAADRKHLAMSLLAVITSHVSTKFLRMLIHGDDHDGRGDRGSHVPALTFSEFVNNLAPRKELKKNMKHLRSEKHDCDLQSTIAFLVFKVLGLMSLFFFSFFF